MARIINRLFVFLHPKGHLELYQHNSSKSLNKQAPLLPWYSRPIVVNLSSKFQPIYRYEVHVEECQ